MITAKKKTGTTDLLVHTGPCKVSGFYVASTGVDGTSVYLVDGVDAGGEMIRQGNPAVGGDVDYRMNPPVEFKTGIFIYVVVAPQFWEVEFII